MSRGVYLAYPIDLVDMPASQVFMFQQIERFKNLVLGAGASWVFDPGEAFSVRRGAPTDECLPAINRAALNWADVTVAFLSRDIVSVGVPMEIDRARAQGKEVFVFTDASSSWMLNMRGVHVINGWQDEQLEAVANWVGKADVPSVNKQHKDLPFQLLGENGKTPSRTYQDDAGLDLFVAETTVIPPGEFVDIPTEVAVELDPHTWGLVTGRSSAFRNLGLMVVPGVIDAGYRGELFSAAFNTRDTPVTVQKGNRIAQLIVLTNSTRYYTPINVTDLVPSERGNRGFGSSGA